MTIYSIREKFLQRKLIKKSRSNSEGPWFPMSVLKLAEIETFIVSKDGKVRAANIRVPNNHKRQTVILRRSLQHLIPLEVRRDTPNQVSSGKESDNNAEDISKNITESRDIIRDQQVGRPMRNTAVIGEMLCKDRV